jgi:hypothetical protein
MANRASTAHCDGHAKCGEKRALGAARYETLEGTPENSETAAKPLKDQIGQNCGFSEMYVEIARVLLCRPLRNHSATWPQRTGSMQAIKDLGNHS